MFHQTHIIWIVTQGPMAHVFFCFCDDLSRFSDVQSQPSWDIQSTNDICSHIHLLQRANQESRKNKKRLKVQMNSWWPFVKILNFPIKFPSTICLSSWKKVNRVVASSSIQPSQYGTRNFRLFSPWQKLLR